jgi:hypothetical protein
MSAYACTCIWVLQTLHHRPEGEYVMYVDAALTFVASASPLFDLLAQVCVCVCEREREVFVCVCMCVYVCVCVCVCVCVVVVTLNPKPLEKKPKP